MLEALALVVALSASGGSAVPAAQETALPAVAASARVTLPATDHVPFLGDGRTIRLAAYTLDADPVSKAQYAAFVARNPGWRRDLLRAVYADAGYLSDWRTPTDPGAAAESEAVVNVSWFAARAFCEEQGGRLPLVDEWESAAAASETQTNALGDVAFRQRVLQLTMQSSPRLGNGFETVHGVRDLHGVVREWVDDFNTAMVSDDSRGKGSTDGELYCAAGATNARDASDYAAFLRYAYRSALNGRSTQSNLGFRCAGGAS